MLDADMHLCCQDATQKVCGDFGAELRDFKGEDDQVHLLAGYPPKLSVAGLADSLNGVLARQMRSQFTAT